MIKHMPTASFALAAFLLMALPASAARQVAVITDGEFPAPASHGLLKLEEALRAQGLDVTHSPAAADYVIVAGTPSDKTVADVLKTWQAPLPTGAEALTVWRGQYKGKPAAALCGADKVGLMYAALDAADRISWTGPEGDPLASMRNTTEKPFLLRRAISMYTMQRAYFESRLYDEQYWTRYFDMLARDRLNSFVVIFGYENGGFMAPLYPYFFNVDGFPDVEFVGLTKQQQARNTAAFKTLIRLAHERGIQVTAAIWDHIYRGGVQGGGIPGASQNAGKRVAPLVWGVTPENLVPYTKAALRRFLEVFPEIDALQFRMHDESGLKKDEIQPFWHDVFASIKKDHPDLRLDLRAKELPDAVIDDALNLGLKARISTKYWMEQMGLPFHPTHINIENQHDRRHGYADLLRYPQRYRIDWQLWSGGTTRLLLWGDPDYVRRFAATAKLYDGDSFEVNEMLATKMLGEPHDEKPLDILNAAYRYYDYEFERYWHFYRLWGRLTYNPETPPGVWEHAFTERFGPQAGVHVMRALHLASQVLPRIVAASYRYQNFPTTRGWAEMNRQGSLPQYAGEEGSDIQQFMNVHDEAESILAKTDTAMRRPEETSQWFAQTAATIGQELAQAEKASGAHPTNEFRVTVADLKILAGLARYHGHRLLAGVAYNLAWFDDAIAHEKDAIASWGEMVAAAGDVFSDNLAFGPHAVGFSRHWKEEYNLLQRDFQKLQAERDKATGQRGEPHTPLIAHNIEPPAVRLLSPPPATPGHDVRIAATVTSPSGIKWVRLRYRHVTQYEDYQTADMSLDPRTGQYTASIPASFIDPKWDLMYFVEAVDRKGAGRMFPDLEVETPYRVLPRASR